jgi:hypothetical protein
MTVQDVRFDSYYKYIWYQDSGEWSSRFSIWYTAGLFRRNQGDDVANAQAVIKSVWVKSRFHKPEDELLTLHTALRVK